MRMWSPIRVFDRHEEDLIHTTMLRILDEVGLVVENEEILERLAELGGRIDPAAMRVTFAPDFMEAFIAESEDFDWKAIEPTVSGGAGVFFGYYLNPDTDQYEPWTMRTILRYLKVIHYLEHVNGGISYAFPIDDIPDEAQVLFFHYLALKFHGHSAASLNDVRWCPAILEMCQAAAEEMGVGTGDLFNAHVHLISPLKLSREEARIYAFFAKHGLQIGIGNMSSAGGTAPVTLAGALAIHLAQGLFINILRRAYFGDRHLGLGCEMSALDMRTGMYPYGRPEKEICNVAMAQMARRYGAGYGGHCGHSDAKAPSVEAGFQRALSSIPTLLACGHTHISAGLLSVDEVYSPIQMIIDDDIISALQHFARGFEVSEETLAFEVIKEVGPGGSFLATDHTARHHRSALWEPQLFSREMFGSWQRSGGKIDVDVARDIYHDIVQREPPPVHIGEPLEHKLLDLIHEATGARIEPVAPE